MHKVRDNMHQEETIYLPCYRFRYSHIRIHMLLLPLISILLEVMTRYAGNDDIIFSLHVVGLHIHSTLFTNIE